MDVQEAVAIFLYIVDHNTQMRPAGDKFQHSTKTISHKFRRVLQAVHTYGQHLIKPDPNVVGLPEHMRSNNNPTAYVFPFVGEMVAYFQRHYDKCLMRTSILSGKDYMAEVRDSNPTNCHDMFRMTLDLFYHLVDELK